MARIIEWSDWLSEWVSDKYLRNGSFEWWRCQWPRGKWSDAANHGTMIHESEKWSRFHSLRDLFRDGSDNWQTRVPYLREKVTYMYLLTFGCEYHIPGFHDCFHGFPQFWSVRWDGTYLFHLCLFLNAAISSSECVSCGLQPAARECFSVPFSVIKRFWLPKHALITSLLFNGVFFYEHVRLDEEHRPFKAQW